jgi:hypothetical protein
MARHKTADVYNADQANSHGMNLQKRGKTEEGGEAILYRDNNRWLLVAQTRTNPSKYTHLLHPDLPLLDAFGEDLGIRVTWEAS